ncbi:MAG: ATP-dependent Clp protease adaptor ClpS [Bacteroidota bacterium]
MNSTPTLNLDTDELTITDDVQVIDRSEMIVYNDDHNTFDWVIQCFIEVCGHTFEQSEQLSLIIHYKGKATVKTGPYDELKPLKDELVSRGLSAVIESYQEKE